MKKVALITGASSGIGKELAYIHAEYGGDLIVVARRENKLLELKSELESKFKISVATIEQDLSQTGSASVLFEKVQNSGIQVDYLINNAGFGLRGKFYELDWKRQQQMMQLNMVSLSELTYLFLPKFIERNSGKILNTSSTASFMPGPLQAVYFATKAYVTFLSNALSEELNGTNITVTNLMPGATATEFASTSGMDKTQLFNKTATARSVAEDGYSGMLAGKMDVISGVTTAQKIMMNMIPFTPKKMLLKQVRQMQEI
jgi:short-subunit dehydrogenase